MDEDLDALDEDLDEFDKAGRYLSRHFPRAWRVLTIAFGAFLIFGGLLDLAMAIGGFIYVVSSEPVHVSWLVLLLPLAFGIGLIVWGSGLVRRAWASKPSVAGLTIRAPSPRGGWSAERER
jgi:hypothetical protein